MGERWALALIVCVLSVALVSAHKMPVIEYTYVGHIWEESFFTIPRVSIAGQPIEFKLSVVHPNETIDGNVTGLLSIYRDHTTYAWYGGKSYKEPDILLVKEAGLQPEGDNTFRESVVIGEPGSYHILVDWYQDGQYIGQSMHMMDVETRTVGPLFLVFSALVVVGVLLGVWVGVL